MAQPFVARRPSRGEPDPPPDGAPAVERRVLPELGALAVHAEDPAVTDLLLDGAGRLWADCGAGPRPLDAPALPAVEARRLAVALIAAGDRHLDDANPCADVRLPGGVRAHAVLPPVSTAGPLVSVRIGRARPWRLADLRDAGMLTEEQEARLVAAVRDRRNLLVCGPAGTGKTSLLAALLAEVPHDQRIVTIEDVAELVVDHPHVVGMEARQANADGAGGLGLPALVKESLRMRPDRIVLGECRGAEIADLLAALNTGHDGGAGTLHCTSADDLAARLEALGALAGLTPAAVRAQAIAAIDVVVQLGRVDGRRVVQRIGALERDGGDGLRVVDG